MRKYNLKFLILLLLIPCILVIDGCKKPIVTPEAPVDIVVNNTTIEIIMGDTYQLSAQILPDKAEQKIDWSVSSDEIISISDSGLVSGLKEGTAYVYATATNKKELYKVIKVTVLHPLLEEDIYDAEYIITAPGENASTMISINYHTHNTKTSVEYAKVSDGNFSGASVIQGSGRYFTHTHTVTVEFPPRNVYRVTIENLEPGTEYMYRVNKGNNTYSDTYYFKTAAGSNNKTSFLVLSDNHYYVTSTGSSGAEVSEQTISNAQKAFPDISFILETGDVVDTGGNADIWDMMFDLRDSYKQIPVIGVPGNHEYYTYRTGMGDNSYFAAYNASPFNGVTATTGSSCYFVHNDTLFIMIDNVKHTNYNEQIAWIEHTIQTVEAKFVICSMHIPVNYENGDRDEGLMAVFEKYSVDLVLSGHYHSENYSLDYYQGSSSNNSNLGVNYLCLAASGVKGISGEDPETFAKGYVIEIENNTIVIKKINAKGNVLQTKTLTTKKHQTVQAADKSTLENSIKTVLDEENNKLTFEWSSLFYGNVEKITIKETLRNTLSAEIFFPTPGYTYWNFNQVVIGYDYNFDFTLYYPDGTTKTLTYPITRSGDINLQATDITKNSVNLTFNSAIPDFLYMIRHYEIYINGELYGTSNYLNGNTPISNILISDLKASTNYTIEIVAIGSGNKVFYKRSVTFKTK